MPLARTAKGRAFTAESTAACLIGSGEPSHPHRPQCPFSNRWFLTSFSPLLTKEAYPKSQFQLCAAEADKKALAKDLGRCHSEAHIDDCLPITYLLLEMGMEFPETARKG